MSDFTFDVAGLKKWLDNEDSFAKYLPEVVGDELADDAIHATPEDECVNDFCRLAQDFFNGQHIFDIIKDRFDVNDFDDFEDFIDSHPDVPGNDPNWDIENYPFEDINDYDFVEEDIFDRLWVSRGKTENLFR